MLLDPANPQPGHQRGQEPSVSGGRGGTQREGTLRRRCRLRQCKYLNNMIEQDHRVSKKRVWLARGYQSFSTAWRTFTRNRGSPHDSEGASQMGG
jgi:hypothetical protein